MFKETLMVLVIENWSCDFQITNYKLPITNLRRVHVSRNNGDPDA
jgi:hypothetical protein